MVYFRFLYSVGDKKCPQMCKNRFKKSEFRGWPFSVIVEELGDTKDIDSIMVIVDKEEDVLLAQITEEDDDVDKHDIFIESWIKRLGAGEKVFFEDMLKEDIVSRSEHGEDKAQNTLPAIETPSELVEVMKSMKEIGDQMNIIEEKVNGFDERLARVEAFVKEEQAERGNDGE